MDTKPRTTLCEIVTKYGTSICDDPRRCKGLLWDLCGAHRREVKVLVVALREGVVAELISSSSSVPKEILLARLSKRMYDDAAIDHALARWAVESWALALGLVDDLSLAANPKTVLGTDMAERASSIPLEAEPQAAAGKGARPDGGNCPLCVPSAEQGKTRCKYCGHDTSSLIRNFGRAPRLASPVNDTKPDPKLGEVYTNPKDGSEMLWVPEGEFIMGSGEEHDERPQRTVYLDGYRIGKHPVTVVQYREFCRETGRATPDAPSWGWIDDHPMVNVTWLDAADYAKWAGCRLPTEAEWEKAARGTDGREYPWGNEWDKNRCNSFESKKKRTMPVGSYPSGLSPYGCHDMAGNVCEWCSDWYGGNYYKNAPSRNPTGPRIGDYRVLRGSGCYSYVNIYRCAFRIVGRSSEWSFNLGFRLAR